MPNQGGRYVIRDGQRELVHRTKPAPTQKPEAAAKTKAAAKADPKPAAKAAESKPIEEKGNG